MMNSFSLSLGRVCLPTIEHDLISKEDRKFEKRGKKR